jgi:hypothetical protein
MVKMTFGLRVERFYGFTALFCDKTGVMSQFVAGDGSRAGKAEFWENEKQLARHIV